MLGSKPFCVTTSINPQKTLFSLEQMLHMQKVRGLTQNTLVGVVSDLRGFAKNRRLVESGLKRACAERNSFCSDIFQVRQFHGSPAVFCTDVNSLKARVAKKRGREPVLVKIGVDKGRKLLKASASYLSETDLVSQPPSKRRRFADELSDMKQFKADGVKQLLILAVTPNCDEDYSVLRDLLHFLNLKPDTFQFCVDLKVANKCIGIMSHSARHPCPFCHWVKGSVFGSPILRTFERITSLHNAWVAAGSNSEDLKHFFNCVQLPLRIFGSGPVIFAIPLPPLHIKLGIVNKLYTEARKVWVSIDDWPASLHIVKSDYHGEQFEGNECSRLLRSTPQLTNMILRSRLSGSRRCRLFGFVAAFDAWANLMYHVYGFSLQPGWESAVEDFVLAYYSLRISITSKAHIVCHHLVPFCKHTGHGLGRYTEQAMEAVHYDLNNHYQRHKIKDSKNPHFGQSWKQTICEYNGMRA